MRRTFLKTVAAAAGLAALGLGSAASAQSAAEFYKDNVIKWIVPYDPGGGYDEYSRMLAPYFEKYTGARVDIVNMPGSGGMKGAVEIFNSPNDGTYIGIINGSAMVTNQLAQIEGANYKVGQYEYLGRMVADPRVMVVSALSGIESFEDMMNNGRPEIVGATGLGGSTYVDAVIIGDAFGIDQRVVHGFDRSGDIRTAMLRGDVQAMWGSLGSALKGIESGDHKVILHAEKEDRPELGGAPSIYDVAKTTENPERATKILRSWEALNAVGRPVAAPPGIPEDRLAFLREAFAASMNDAEFVSQMEEAGRDLLYASGEEMSEIAKAATELEPDIEALFVRAIRGEI
ncbi:Bug family tripartite tricarboxylate transporter substrate binding protein [Ovoidimarina sediminis]|uniref:Bug family tripartite tricarboxylate transporter substrate binding protein n=1 Tax=Ovoidimarina sediminis TaxID=3079856 RepID=UPI002907595C|nr:tripartite tricarboxylate transporter substrate-binding protein [Rhodophyticola sp. MJ-SS7]MDU8941805.1 tripartite tricarboxylate transporter substrate-binding protein [Rhodophyticola sp. MJ-SS7]